MKFLAIINVFCALHHSTIGQHIEGYPSDSDFQDPPPIYRPRFRYWVPDASVNSDVLAQDVNNIAEAGAGGMELIGFYGYGTGPGSFAPTDWARFGWGTKEWERVLDTVIEAHRENELLLDVALGPSQGAGVPAEESSDGLQWDLVMESTSYENTLNDKLPGWGRGKLVAATIGNVIASVNTTGSGFSLPNEAAAIYDIPRVQKTLRASSLQDVTVYATPDGKLTPSFNGSSVTTNDTVVFAFYLVHTDNRAVESPLLLQGPQTVPEDFVQNGSWIVDHFSTLGAQTTIDFWEQNLLTRARRKALAAVAQFMWEDSLELNPPYLYWTRDLPEKFQADHGYSIHKYLPLLFHENIQAFSSPYVDNQTWYITDEPDHGNGPIADYRTTLGNLYGEYLDTLQTWAAGITSSGYSAQVVYGIPADMLALIPRVAAPEDESLNFPLVEQYRLYVGPAHLAGNRIISNEMGATFSAAYQQTLPELLHLVNRALVSGNNRFVLHGYAYSGEYPNTTWPGFTAFNYFVSENHGPRQPAWSHYKDSMMYIARNSYIMQSGVPKVDIVFYSKFATYPSIPDQINYAPLDLVQAGYTYEYLSPDNFALPAAYVRDGIFAPERQSFKALILRANDSMTDYGVKKLAEYAHAGLPVIMSGGVPTSFLGQKPSAHSRLTMRQLTTLPNVHIVPYEGLASSLGKLGLEPKTKICVDGSWYTHWRQLDDKVYILVFNDAAAATANVGRTSGTLEVATSGYPWLMDAWTGQQTPIKNYTRTRCGTIKLYLELAANQTAIIGFSSDPDPPTGYRDYQKLEVKPHNTYELTNWTCILEHWDAPANMSDFESFKHNTTHELSRLVPWYELPGVGGNVSGIGRYNTSFNIPRRTYMDAKRDGNTGSILLDLGVIYHTVSVSVNGQQLPPLDLTWARCDISPHIVQGENSVEVVVASTLFNALKPVGEELHSSGASTLSSNLFVMDSKPYGLLSPVTLSY